MPRYLVAIHHPDDYDPSVEAKAMARYIDALNDEMAAAGVRVLMGGLLPASSAKSLLRQPNPKVLLTDGPYLEAKEHIDGFWVLEAADMDEALSWGPRLPSLVRRLSRCARLEFQRKQLSSVITLSSIPACWLAPRAAGHACFQVGALPGSLKTGNTALSNSSRSTLY